MMLAVYAFLFPTDMEPYNGIPACNMVGPLSATMPLMNYNLDSLKLGCDNLSKINKSNVKKIMTAVEGEQLMPQHESWGALAEVAVR